MTHARGLWLNGRVAVIALTMTAVALGTTPTIAARESGRKGPQARTVVTQPPTVAPATITATGATSRVRVEWAPVAGASGYKVFRAIGGVWSPDPIASVSRARFEDRGLTNGVTHTYRVAGVNRAGTGPSSSEASATPLASPTALAAVAGDATVTLTWGASVGATGYTVLRGLARDSMVAIATNVGATTFVDTGLTNGTAYLYRVRATTLNSESASTSAVTATPVGTAPPPPSSAPTGLQAVPGDAVVQLSWNAVTNATGYKVYRATTTNTTAVLVATVAGTTFSNSGLTNGVTYVYRVAGLNAGGDGPLSDPVSATPVAPPPPLTAPTNLSATPGNGMVTLAWSPVTGATTYRVYRGTAANAQASTPVATDLTTPAFVDSGLVNGTPYFYKVTAVAAATESARSAEASATPQAPITPPTNLSATPGDTVVTVAWAPAAGATSYRVYRGTVSNGQASTPVATDLTSPTFVDSGLVNGTTYFYKVTSVAAGTESARSVEVSATPAGLPPVEPTTLSAFRLLRHSTWGPKPGDVERVKGMGAAAFVDEQIAASPSVFPDALYDQSVEVAQEHFMSVALSQPDQLRQRVAWALHKIWVVSAVEINNSRAIVPYYRVLLNNAFGRYRDLMRAVTVNPAMGRYLNMANNRAQAVTGVAPNENYARELLQLFTLGLTQLNPDGTPVLDNGSTVPAYSEEDVKALARILTGWTYGDGDQATIPGGSASQNFLVEMEPVSPTRGFHDTTAKRFLGQDFPAGVSAVAEMEHALDVIFGHPNLAPFISRQLIQQLVTSNPSPAYVGDVAGVFASSGGDLGAVVRAILLHSEAATMTTTSGKLSEPVLYTLSMVRGLNATVTNHPFLSDLTAEMGQRVFFPPSVFSYFSPSYRVRGTGPPPVLGPEFQGLTSVTAVERANFAGRLLGGHFGTESVTVDYTPFTDLAATPEALVAYVNQLFMGGRMSAEQQAEILSAVRVSPATSTLERARTALYLTIVAAQAQVDN